MATCEGPAKASAKSCPEAELAPEKLLRQIVAADSESNADSADWTSAADSFEAVESDFAAVEAQLRAVESGSAFSLASSRPGHVVPFVVAEERLAFVASWVGRVVAVVVAPRAFSVGASFGPVEHCQVVAAFASCSFSVVVAMTFAESYSFDWAFSAFVEGSVVEEIAVVARAAFFVDASCEVAFEASASADPDVVADAAGDVVAVAAFPSWNYARS